MPEKKMREYLVDAIRGCAVLSMVAYHFCYDFFVVCGRDAVWFERPGIHLWQQSICWSFILVSGYVWRWGREHALRRGLLLNLLGLLVTGVTLLVLPEEVIWFGILSFLGCAVLAMLPLDRLLCRVPPQVGLLGALLLFALLRRLPVGSIGLGIWQGKVPAKLYALRWLTPLGLPYPGFRSADYFPLLPWLPLYLAGYFLYPLLRRRALWQRAAAIRLPLLEGIGQNSLWIYLLHQPLCLGLCLLLFRG